MKNFKMILSLMIIVGLLISFPGSGSISFASDLVTKAETEGTIMGIVTAMESGAPIQGVNIWIDGADYWGFAVTDAQGRYSVTVPAGNYTVKAQGYDVGYSYFSEDGVVVAADEMVTVDFALEKLVYGTISGTVTDMESGVPVEGVEILIGDDEQGYHVIYTDEYGEYSLTVSAGQHNVEARGYGAGYSDFSKDGIVVAENEIVIVDFALDKLEFGTISGTVTDMESGAPIEDVEILIGNDEQGYHVIYTDEHGEYGLTVSAGDYTVEACGSAVGYSNDSKEDIAVAADETITVDFALEKLEFGTISGTVTDVETGTPLEDINIQFADYEQGHWFSIETDSQGKYCLTVPVGNYNVLAWGGGAGYSDYSDEGIVVAVNEAVVLDFALKKLLFGTISGTVTDVETGEPIEDVAIRFTDHEQDYWKYVWTDEQGDYSMTVPVGNYTVEAWGYEVGYSDYSRDDDVVVVENESVTVDFALEKLVFGNVNGTITDVETGAPLENIRIDIGDYEQQGRWYHTETDAQGRYSLPVPVGCYTVEAWGYEVGYSDYSRDDVVVVENESVIVDFALEKLVFGTISGTVTDAKTGVPINDIAIQFTDHEQDYRRWVWTDNQGRYNFTIPVGSYTVQAWGLEAGYSNQSEDDIVVTEDETAVVNFALEKLVFGTITGTVTEVETGLPVENLEIHFSEQEHGYWLSAKTDGQGNYHLTVPVGEYTVEVWGYEAGYSDYYKSGIVVTEDETAVVNFALEKFLFGVINGTVTAAESGVPIKNVEIRIIDYEQGHWLFCETDSQGNYSLTVPVGTYTVKALGFDMGYANYFEDDIVVGENHIAEVDFVFEKLTFGTISGAVTDAESGAPVANIEIEIADYERDYWYFTETDLQGNYSLAVPAGNYTITVWGWQAGYFDSKKFNVAVVESKTTVVDLALDKLTFGTISGTVIDAETGAPIEGVMIWVSNIDYVHWAETDHEGKYSLAVPTFEDYYVDAWDPQGEYAYSFVENIVVQKDKTTVVNFALEYMEIAAVAAAEKAVAAPFGSTAGVAELKEALMLYNDAHDLVADLPDGEDKTALENRLAAVWTAIETREGVLADEAEAALSSAEARIAAPFPESGTADEVNAVKGLVAPHIPFVVEFMDAAVKARLNAVLSAADTRYSELLEAAGQLVETEWNETKERYDARLEFADGTVSIQIESDSPLDGVRLTAIRSCINPVPVTPSHATAANIYLDIRVLEGTLLGSDTLIEVGYDPAQLPEGVSEADLKLYRYNKNTKTWELLPDQGVDQERRVIWARTNGEFGIFGVFELGVPYGDLNLDGNIDMVDVIMLMRHIVSLAELNDEELLRADLNGDGNVDVGDANLILRHIAGLQDKFPVEQE